MAGESLSVLIGANSDPLVQELNKAAASVSKFGNDVKKSLDDVSRSASEFSDLLGVGIGGGIAFMAKSLVDSARTLSDHADQLGLNVEKYQELSLAAQHAGIDQETFNTGLNRLSKTLGEAQAGSQAAQDVLAKWGIAARDANGNALDLATVVNEVADRIQSITDPALRTAAAFDLMGRGGANLINFFAQGSSGLADMSQKMRDLGAVMDSETIEKAKNASIQLEELGNVIKTKLTADLVDFMPVLEGIGKGLAVIGDAAKGAAFLVGMFKNQIDSLLHGGGDPVETFKKTMQQIEDAQTVARIPFRKDRAASSTSGASSISGGSGFTPSDPAAARAQADADAKAAQDIQDLIDRIKEQTKEMGLNNEQREISKELYAAEAIARKDNRELTQQETDDITAAARARATEAESLLAVKQQMEDAKKYADQLATSFTNAFGSLIDGSKTAQQALYSLITALEKTVLQFSILEPLQNNLRSLFGAAPSSLANAASGASDFFGNIFSFRANGGSVTGGDPYVVGERGPELFVPNVSGGIVPNNQLSTSGSGMNNNFNMNVTVSGPAAGDPATAAKAGNAFAMGAKSAMLGFLVDQQRSGGVLAQGGL